MPGISVVIITLNEERNIGRCIDSVQAIADEVLVVDSFSTDRTKAISLEKGARFIEHQFEGHIEQKNWAWQQATQPFVLSLDADEALSDELSEAIQKLKPELCLDGYSMKRLTNYCGQWIRHSGWYPDIKIRLFAKGKGSWRGVNPHDRYDVDEPTSVGFIEADILHYTFATVEEHKAQVVKFTDISSKAMFQLGKRSSWLRIVFSPVAKFIRNYILRRGFLDGYNGWLICSISAKATYWKYLKLYRLQKRATHGS